MPEIPSEKSEMSSVEFAQYALRSHVAPAGLGSVKARLRHAVSIVLKHDRKQHGRKRRWTANRVKDCWYADERITPNADEIRDLEEITGLKYGREELRELAQLISSADALLEGPHEDFYRPFVDAFRQALRVVARSGTEG